MSTTIAREFSAGPALEQWLIARLLPAIGLLALAWQPAIALTMEEARENCRNTVGRPIVQACMGGQKTVEYGLSIALSFLTGNILVILVLFILPTTIASGGKPNAAAYRIARMLGQHVGQETMRRRARRIQDLMQTVGPLAGVVATAAGSIYTGLKGVIGP